MKKSKIVCFASSIMKNTAVSPAGFRFLVKLICYIAFGSASNFCYLRKSAVINL